MAQRSIALKNVDPPFGRGPTAPCRCVPLRPPSVSLQGSATSLPLRPPSLPHPFNFLPQTRDFHLSAEESWLLSSTRSKKDR